MMKLFLKSLILLLILRSEGILSQTTDSLSTFHMTSTETIKSPVDYKLKNNIYAGGSIGLLYLSESINYERMVAFIGKSKFSTLYLRGTFGQWEAWGAGGTAGLIAINLVFSKRPGHFESGLGYMILHERESSMDDLPQEEQVTPSGDKWYHYPNINAGFRYQHPVKHFFFRIGLAFPEGAYAGIGIHF